MFFCTLTLSDIAFYSGRVRPEGREAFPLARNEPYGNRTQSVMRIHSLHKRLVLLASAQNSYSMNSP